MKPQVAEIIRLIEAGADDPRLRWSPDRTTVTVVYSRLILDGAPMLDAQGRRMRLGDGWQAAIAEHGWCRPGTAANSPAPATRGTEGPRLAAGRSADGAIRESSRFKLVGDSRIDRPTARTQRGSAHL